MEPLRLLSLFLIILFLPILKLPAQENKVNKGSIGLEIKNKWIRPSTSDSAKPVWGLIDGIQVGLSPMPGPRGLIRVYTPYLNQDAFQVMNYLTLQPIVKGDKAMGLSELEMSELDEMPGKRFWSSNDSLQTLPHKMRQPARGVIASIGGQETLTLYVFSERFENGAQVYVRLRFFENQPNQIEIKTYATTKSEPLDSFVVTATMGNYARLRNLYLTDKIVSSLSLWPDYKDNKFSAPVSFPVSKFIKDKSNRAYFIAVPNEENPEHVKYGNRTASNWKYKGKSAIQYWSIKKPNQNVKGVVNGRYTYWKSQTPIPGGIAFENFELKMPFKEGQTFVFGISSLTPQEFIDQVK